MYKQIEIKYRIMHIQLRKSLSMNSMVTVCSAQVTLGGETVELKMRNELKAKNIHENFIINLNK